MTMTRNRNSMSGHLLAFTCASILVACNPASPAGDNSPGTTTQRPASTPDGPLIELKRGDPPTQASAPTVAVAANELVDGNGKALQLAGVNVAGVEEPCVLKGFQQGATADKPGPVLDYGGPVPDPPTGMVPLPPQSYVDAIASWHANVVRIMINEMCWLGRGRPNANPPTAPIPEAHYDAAAYRQAVIDFMNALHAKGVAVLLTLGDNPCASTDLKPPGSEYSPCGDSDQLMPDADNSVDFWSSAAKTFADDHAVLFDLFNEPHINRHEPAPDDTWGCWLNGCTVPGEGWKTAGMQQLIDAIRATGATNVIVVEGLSYSGDLGLPATQDLPATGWLDTATRPVDRISPPQLAASNHLYPGYYNGLDRGCTDQMGPSCWAVQLDPVAALVPLITGEFGEFDCATSGSQMDAYEAWADKPETLPDGSRRAPVSYVAWTFNPDYHCNEGNTTLLEEYDWNITPNAAGRAYRDHLVALHP